MNKKILIAEDSKLIKSFLTNVLEDAGYKVLEADNAFNTINKIQKNAPDCVICSTELSILNGFELSKIIKNRDALNIPVILYTLTEENFPESLIKSSICDKLVVFDSQKPETFLEAIASTIADNEYAQKNPPKDLKSDELTISTVKEITGYYQRENELLNIINSIFNVFESNDNPRAAALGILDNLLNFVPYDVVLLSVCNADRIHDFCRLHSNLSEDEVRDFILVSHSKVLNNCNQNVQMKFYDCIYNQEGTLPEFKTGNSERIKSIETTYLYGEDFLGAITVGKCQNDFYNEFDIQKFNFFTEKLCPFLMNVLSQYKIKNAYKSLRKVFSSFVPEEIIDDLVVREDIQTETAGEKRRIAVLTCDIRHFTNISEKNKAENVVSFLNSYFTEMVEIIKRHGGSIDKFMGDAIMALFGAPISYEDNAQRAVEAAVEMIEMLPKIDSSILNLPEDIGEISIGIGIHYGEVVLGSIGCADKKDYTVIGDSVNLASRMEGLTKLYGNHILISNSVRQELDSSVQTHKLDKVTVKGKKIPVWVYSVENTVDKLSQEYYRNYDKAMELYEVGAWALAADYFYKALQNAPESKAAALMRTRCLEYNINPPEHWDGAVIMTSK